ncbi:MAG: DUF1838 family protein [Steroidobacteraceae bacterium]
MQGGFDRRDFLRAAGGASALLATTSLGTAAVAATTKPAGGAFDPLSPVDNLRAYIRMTRSLDPAATTVGWFGGRIFSVIGDTEIIKPLFDIEGFGIGRTEPGPDGSYRCLWREVGYYKDLATGQIMETWDNPLNGEQVEVYPINNDPVNAVLKPEFTLGFNATKDQHAPTIKFLMPWNFVGDNAMSAFDVNLDWKSPLTPRSGSANRRVSACASANTSSGASIAPNSRTRTRRASSPTAAGTASRLAALDADGPAHRAPVLPLAHAEARSPRTCPRTSSPTPRSASRST